LRIIWVFLRLINLSCEFLTAEKIPPRLRASA
jgi:hypothetical protein